MIARIHKAMKEDQKGFTLVELLVVVIIIGILAAIAIPVYMGQQNKAKDAAAKSDLSNAKTAVVAYLVETAAPTEALVKAVPLPKSDSTTSIGVKSYSATGFCIDAVSGTGTAFKTTDKTGPVAGACP